jgi:hypothetical protein
MQVVFFAGLRRESRRISALQRYSVGDAPDYNRSDPVSRRKDRAMGLTFSPLHHKWRVGDLVMWDNQATMHRGRPYDDTKYPRDLRRTTLTCGMPAMAMA